MLKHTKSLVLAFPLFFSLALASCGESKILVTTGYEIDKIGGLKIQTTGEDVKKHNIEFGDIVTAKVAGKSYDLPVVPSYTYVAAGCYYVMWHVDYGRSISSYYNNFTKEEGITEDMLPLQVTFEIKEKGGYMAEYILRHLERSNNRLDYRGETPPYLDLNDEDYANFREVSNAKIKPGVIYRSSSPINEALNRNVEADTACRNHHIKTIINLTDYKEAAESMPGYANSYYKAVAEHAPGTEGSSVFYNPLDVYVKDHSFAYKVAETLRYMLDHQGPYLFHCDEGQDRTGIVIAILEGLMGVSYDDVRKEYMKTFANFYGITDESPQYLVFASNLSTNLNNLFHHWTDETNFETNILEYLRNYGFTDAKIQALKAIMAS